MCTRTAVSFFSFFFFFPPRQPEHCAACGISLALVTDWLRHTWNLTRLPPPLYIYFFSPIALVCFFSPAILTFEFIFSSAPVLLFCLFICNGSWHFYIPFFIPFKSTLKSFNKSSLLALKTRQTGDSTRASGGINQPWDQRSICSGCIFFSLFSWMFPYALFMPRTLLHYVHMFIRLF